MANAAVARRLRWNLRAVRSTLSQERLEAEARELEQLATRLLTASQIDDVRAVLKTELPYALSIDASSVWRSQIQSGVDEIAAARALAFILLRWARKHRCHGGRSNTAFSRRVLRQQGHSGSRDIVRARCGRGPTGRSGRRRGRRSPRSRRRSRARLAEPGEPPGDTSSGRSVRRSGEARV